VEPSDRGFEIVGLNFLYAAVNLLKYYFVVYCGVDAIQPSKTSVPL
jgi:hypothetical protein